MRYLRAQFDRQSIIKGGSATAVENDSVLRARHERVHNFLLVPFRYECLILSGMTICLDALLHNVTILPLRALLSIKCSVWSNICFILRFRKKRHPCLTQDVLKVLLISFNLLMLSWVDSSRIYHLIRGQSVIKLYVIYNVFEVFDKLCCSFGLDTLEAMFSPIFGVKTDLSLENSLSPTVFKPLSSKIKSTEKVESKYSKTFQKNSPNVSGHQNSMSKSTAETAKRENSYEAIIQDTGTIQETEFSTVNPILHFCIAIGYVFMHTLILLLQAITLNVSINSFSNSLLTLLVSNQFVEIKSAVFKRFERENLFQLSCADIVERFHLCAYVIILAARNLTAYGSDSLEFHTIAENLLIPLFVVLATEIIVDWLKHAFITKFNHINPVVYLRFVDSLAREFQEGAHGTFLDQSPAISRRIGFSTLPLTCLIIYVIQQSIKAAQIECNLYSITIMVLLYLAIFSIKIRLGILLMSPPHQMLQIRSPLNSTAFPIKK